jgi:hypothetical protein
MKKSANMFLVSISSAVALALAYILAQRNFVLAQDQAIQNFELSAKKYECSPSPVHAKTGPKFNSKLRLSRRATDRAATLG